MALIVVNGTPLQPKIDSSQPGDTLMPTAGSYAGRISIPKGIAIKGDGAVILEGGGHGDANVDIAAKGALVSGLDLRHAGAALRFKGDCTGSVMEHCVVPVVDFLVYQNPDAGGIGVAWEKSIGGEVRYNQFRKCRAPSPNYTMDGAAFEFYSAQKSWAHHNEVWDNVHVAEFGKGATDPANDEVLIEDNIFHGRANPNTPLPSAYLPTMATGLLLRPVSRLTVRRNVFDLLDFWAEGFEAGGGNYGSGAYSALSVTDNIYRLAPGVNRMVSTVAGVPLAQVTHDRNKVYSTADYTRVAEIAGTRYTMTQLAAFRTATGWDKNGAWTVGALPPIVPITPPPPVDPVDPCADDLAAANAQIVTLQGQVTAANLAKAAADVKLASAKTSGAVIETEAAKIKAL